MAFRQLEKTYDPHHVEDRWHQFWIDHGYGRASVDHPGQPYCIVMPPPNVTGSLHIGHALNTALQDILIRWRRMQGRNTLWMPGMDHAGIATQHVVEKQLAEEGTSREDLGHEAFIERIWQWKTQSGGTILQQLKRLGASCDWDRIRFTMDEGMSQAVREVFVQLYEENLIYRGERLINWCPHCLTALSDIEVEHEDQSATLYSITYPIDDDSGHTLTIATTRPETMLGDTAVAVHPEDPRYNNFIGSMVRLPLTTRTIPVVGDAILVDREFGTGAVKITPAHDFHDFEAGIRHSLDLLSVFDQEARMSPTGLLHAKVEPQIVHSISLKTTAQARTVVIEALKERGHLTKTEDHTMALGKCYRCTTVVEPYLSPQWFVNIKPLAEPAIQVVHEGRIRIVPEGWVNNYLGWMRDIKDWCISRQIWWGHQIPAWYCAPCGRKNGTLVETSLKTSHGVSATAEGGARPDPTTKSFILTKDAVPIVSRTKPSSCPDCGSGELIQDPDVLDTWFSSAVWPFATLGWPQPTPDLRIYYPTSTLVTGLDILFFWVARMIMMGLKFTGEVPFREVYIHALVRDAEGKKMSKSKGNVIDPLQVMFHYGTDALRFTLASMASPGRDIKLAEERIEGYRNFANKIWNVARFILMHLAHPRQVVPPSQRPFPDRWILSRLNRAIGSVTASLEQFRFDHAARHLYHYIWHEYCDWYLELIKPSLQADTPDALMTRQTLVDSFETTLRLLHPLMPFITEELWQSMPHEGESIVVQPYPTPNPDWEDTQTEAQFEVLSRFVTTIRTGRALLNVQPGASITVYVTSTSPDDCATMAQLRAYAECLGKGTILPSPLDQWPSNRVLRLTVEGMTVGIVVGGTVDLHKAVTRLSKQLTACSKETEKTEAKLAKAEFTSKAPPDVVAEQEARLCTLRHERGMLTSSHAQLQSMMEGPPG